MEMGFLRFVLPLITLLSSTAWSQEESLTQKLDSYFKRAEKNGFSGSVFLSMNDKIIYNRGVGWADKEAKVKETSETVFNIGSIVKQFTAAAILLLESQGKLKVTDSLSKYFSFLNEDKKNITLHQMLTHSSGFPGIVGPDEAKINASDFMDLANKSKLKFPPGSNHAYSNVAYSILGVIIEKLSGKSYDEFLYDNIFRPLEMTSTGSGFFKPKFDEEKVAVGYKTGVRWGKALNSAGMEDGPTWHIRANGGILSTNMDMYKWYRAIKNGTILPRIQMDKYLYPHVREGKNSSSYYGYGWVIEPDGADTVIWHNGGNLVFNTYMGMNLKKNIAIIISSNTDNKIADDYAYAIIKMVNGNFNLLKDDYVNRYEGIYQTTDGVNINVSFDENNNLVSDIYSKEALTLLTSEIGTSKPDSQLIMSQKTKALLTDMFEDKYESLAKAYLTSVDRGRYWTNFYYGDIRKYFGQPKAINLLETYPRRNNVFVSYVELVFDKAKFYTIVGWRGDEVITFRVERSIQKNFNPKPNNEYYSGSNSMTFYFKEADTKPTLYIRKSDKTELAAKKK